MLGTVYFSEVN